MDVDGGVAPCLEVALGSRQTMPFCFVAQRNRPQLQLSSLVSNAAVFEAPLECEMSAVGFSDTSLDATFGLMSSSPAAMERLLAGGLVEHVQRLEQLAGVELVSFQFDGRTLSLLVLPDAVEPGEVAAWPSVLVEAAVAMEQTFRQALLRILSGD